MSPTEFRWRLIAAIRDYERHGGDFRDVAEWHFAEEVAAELAKVAIEKLAAFALTAAPVVK